MPGLEPLLFVVHDPLSKQENWYATQCGDLFSFGVGDDCIENYPLLNGAKRRPFVMLPGGTQGLLQAELASSSNLCSSSLE